MTQEFTLESQFGMVGLAYEPNVHLMGRTWVRFASAFNATAGAETYDGGLARTEVQLDTLDWAGTPEWNTTNVLPYNGTVGTYAFRAPRTAYYDITAHITAGTMTDGTFRSVELYLNPDTAILGTTNLNLSGGTILSARRENYDSVTAQGAGSIETSWSGSLTLNDEVFAVFRKPNVGTVTVTDGAPYCWMSVLELGPIE